MTCLTNAAPDCAVPLASGMSFVRADTGPGVFRIVPNTPGPEDEGAYLITVALPKVPGSNGSSGPLLTASTRARFSFAFS